MTLQISPEVQRAIDRLRKIDPAKPALDRTAADKALRAHLAALDLSDLPIVWVADAQDGYARVTAAARDAASDATMAAGWDAASNAASDAAWAAAGDAARDAARIAAWDGTSACGNLNRPAAFDHPTQHKLAGIWLPIIDAFEAGLFLYWVTGREIVCVPAPTLSLKAGRLHNDTGPAVAWPSGERYWFRNGILVPQ